MPFDGSVMIKDTTCGAGGDVNSYIIYRGCDNDSDPLDICVCGGDVNGTITITTTGCGGSQPSTYTCSTGCP